MGRSRFPNRKYAQAVIATLPDGYTVEPGVGQRHPRILKPDGSVLRDEAGRPVTIAASPRSGPIADISKIRRALRAAGCEA